MMAELEFISGPLAGQSVELPLKKELTLGRADSCDIILNAAGVSRAHCRIEFDGQDFHLVDLGGINGTSVNGERIPKCVLHDRDRIRIGEVEARLCLKPATGKNTNERSTVTVEGFLEAAGTVRCEQCAAPTEATGGQAICEPCQHVGPIQGTRFDNRYTVGSKIAMGGMGAVYKVRDEATNQPIALKILASNLCAEPKSIQRFLRGARVAAGLIHPHIVQVFEVNAWRGIYYIAMEYVDGPTVFDAMKAGNLNEVRKVLRIGIQVARALDHAYEHRVVHRDIKPSNIMLTRERDTKLTDVGLAKSLLEAGISGITGSGASIGTLNYMSPEQIRNARHADHRADIYSLGATLYHLLAQEPVFKGANIVRKMKMIAREMPRSPSEINVEVPAALSGVVLKMLAKAPEDRYQAPRELLADLVSVHQAAFGPSQRDE